MQKNNENMEIVCGKAGIRYSLIRKNVKNINLRVRPDGSVCVSASTSVSLERIDNFVGENAERIIKTIKKFKAIKASLPAPNRYISGESITILGENMRLDVENGEPERVELDGTFLRLRVKDITDFERKESLIKTYLNLRCRKVFAELADEIYPKFLEYGVAMPQIKVREMTTKWGCCMFAKRSITLNSKLIAAPRECIEYVVLHEFCHFVYPNHSKSFYTFLELLMPDWKELKRKLENQKHH